MSKYVIYITDECNFNLFLFKCQLKIVNFRICKNDFPSILLKLLISINRKQGYKAAQDNIELAINCFKKYPQYIVGLDLSGDPMTGSTFLELLKKARLAGLKIAAHCAEV